MAFQSGMIILRDLSILKTEAFFRCRQCFARFLATLQVDKSGDYMQTMSDNAADMAEAMRIANVANIVLL